MSKSAEAAIRREIKRQGLTSADVARLARISQPTAYRFMTGREVTLRTAERLAKGLGLSLEVKGGEA